MTKTTIFALLGLALALTVATPSRANAGVVVGVGIGPVYAPPAYGYVVVHPRPYCPPPVAYAPGYVYRPYPYYGYVGRDWRWDHHYWVHRDWDRDHDFRGDRWHRDWR